jgi:predicted  nucleic acid-binding Zn-ribbon protein
VLNKLQVVEELEGQHKLLTEELEAARTDAGPRGEEIAGRVRVLQDELAIMRDKRQNQALRVDSGALSLYDRIAAGRSRIALAPLTDEGVCGNCFTSVTVQQEMQIKGMRVLVCCEGCGVILYPGDLKR